MDCSGERRCSERPPDCVRPPVSSFSPGAGARDQALLSCGRPPRPCSARSSCSTSCPPPGPDSTRDRSVVACCSPGSEARPLPDPSARLRSRRRRSRRPRLWRPHAWAMTPVSHVLAGYRTRWWPWWRTPSRCGRRPGRARGREFYPSELIRDDLGEPEPRSHAASRGPLTLGGSQLFSRKGSVTRLVPLVPKKPTWTRRSELSPSDVDRPNG